MALLQTLPSEAQRACRPTEELDATCSGLDDVLRLKESIQRIPIAVSDLANEPTGLDTDPYLPLYKMTGYLNPHYFHGEPANYLQAGEEHGDLIRNEEAVGLYFGGTPAVGEEFRIANTGLAHALVQASAAILSTRALVCRLVEHTLFTKRETSAPLAVSWIEAAIRKAAVEDEEKDTLARSTVDAKCFVTLHAPWTHPQVSVTEDGAITLLWRNGQGGLMLVFVGDQTVAYAIKESGGTYSASVRQATIEGDLPSRLRDALSSLDPPVT